MRVCRFRLGLSKQACVDEEAEKRGDLIIALISAVRREKAEKHLSLNTQIKKLDSLYRGQGSCRRNQGRRWGYCWRV